MNATLLRFTSLALLLVVTTAFGFDPKGKYSYRHTGYSGEMIVSEGEVDLSQFGALIEVKPLKVSINTVLLSQFHTCEVEATEETAGRVASESSISTIFMSKDQDSDMVPKFSIEFTPKNAVVKVDDRGGSCGLNGDFGGKWVKVSPKKAKRTN